ncbi:MAG: adenylate kinase [Candidatus Hydrothermarchaeaceae archaeon]
MKMAVIVVTGTPGAGKTTVLNQALQSIKNFEVVNFGDEMFEHAKRMEIVDDRDDLRKQSPDIQREIQRIAAKNVSEKAKNSSIIVDTHCTIKTPKGYLPGLPFWVLEELMPKSIVLVEAEAEDIVSRRRNDEERIRDEEMTQAIEEHQRVNRAAAMAYARVCGATVKMIRNRENKLDEAVVEMIEALE